MDVEGAEILALEGIQKYAYQEPAFIILGILLNIQL